MGPLVVRLDLGWKDGEFVIHEDLESYRLMQFSGTFGLEYSYGESFFGQLSVFSQFGLDALGSRYLVGMMESLIRVVMGVPQRLSEGVW